MDKSILGLSGRRAGFSLVETLLALVLLAVAILTLALVPLATTKLFVHTVDHERATFLATALLERIESGEDVGASGTNGKFTWVRTSAVDAGTGGTIENIQVSWSSSTGNRSSQMERLVGPSEE
ncbi:MAG: hypothetical protein STSR0007_10390 [Thermovirga sp.]